MLSPHHPGRDSNHNLHTRVCSRLHPCNHTRAPALPVQHIWAHSYLCGGYHVGISLDQGALVAEPRHYRGGYLYNWGVK